MLKIRRTLGSIKGSIFDYLDSRPSRFEVVSLISHQLHDNLLFNDIRSWSTLFESSAHFVDNEIDISHSNADSWSCPAIHVLELCQSLTHVGTGNVFLPKSKKYLIETCWGWGKYSTMSLKRYRGNHISLDNEEPIFVFSGIGYHGMVEDLASIFLLIDKGYFFSILIDPSNQWMKLLLEFLLPKKIPIIYVPGKFWVRCKTTISITKSAFGEFVHPKKITRLNDHFQDPKGMPDHFKIYISRDDSAKRRTGYDLRLKEFFTAQGYESVTLTDLPIPQQIEIFQKATEIAGLHGAGFSNLVWTKRKPVVREFYISSHFNSCYSSISHYLGLPYEAHNIETYFN
jgi:hypothetical protein